MNATSTTQPVNGPAADLIARYVHEVGRHLPEKNREDIRREIRSLLEDQLEDRAAEAGRAADEEMAVALLKEFGEPQSVAASYHRPRYLVGPALYPTWEMIVRIVLTVLAILAVVGFAFSIARPGSVNGPAEMLSALGRTIGDLISGIFTSLGIITLIFAINERVLTNLAAPSKAWDPRQLKPVVVETDRVNIASTAVEVAFNLLAIVVLNFYLNRIGIYSYSNGEWTFVPILSEAFRTYVPAITVLTGLKVAQGIWLIEAGGWNTWSRLTDIGLRLFSLALLFAILSGPSIVAPAGVLLDAWSKAGLQEASAASLQGLVETGIRIGLSLGMLGEAIEIVKRLYRMLVKN